MATPRTYQRVGATAGDYDWNVPFPARLVWDGVDDVENLPEVLFAMTDDYLVSALIAPTSTASWRTIFGQDSSGSARLQFLVNGATGQLSAYFRNDAGVNTTVTASEDLRQKTVVVSLLKRGTSVYLRIGGVQVASGVLSLGAATFQGSCIGRLYASTDEFMGGIGSTVTLKGSVSDTDARLVERLLGQKAGLTI